MSRPSPPDPGFGESEASCALALLGLALDEDLGFPPDDLTTRLTIPEGLEGRARVVTRQEGVVSGVPVAVMLAQRLGVQFRPLKRDGSPILPGDCIGELSGSMRSILSLERTLLNFVQRLSGIATMTAVYVGLVSGTRASILDTRKTIPGWRSLDKYAVRCGGGRNHRKGLYDGVLIKDNHLAALAGTGDPIGQAIERARRYAPTGAVVEVEVDSLAQLARALECRPDIVLVDNFGLEGLVDAVSMRDRDAPEVLLEASGGVSLKTVRAIAETGVDRISVGALTHSVQALDLGLDHEV